MLEQKIIDDESVYFLKTGGYLETPLKLIDDNGVEVNIGPVINNLVVLSKKLIDCL